MRAALDWGFLRVDGATTPFDAGFDLLGAMWTWGHVGEALMRAAREDCGMAVPERVVVWDVAGESQRMVRSAIGLDMVLGQTTTAAEAMRA